MRVEYFAEAILIDSDLDGMPDIWEKKFDLKADNSKNVDKDEYRNIEEYLNKSNATEYIDNKDPSNNKNIK